MLFKRSIVAMIAVAAIVASSNSVAADAKAILHWADGRTEERASVHFRDGWKIQESAESGLPAVSAADLVSIEFDATREIPGSRRPAVLLADGQLLHGEIVSTDADTIVLKSPLLQEVKLPLSVVEGFVLTTGLGRRAMRLESDRLRSWKRTSDVIVLANGDALTGTIEQFGPSEWKIAKDEQSRTVKSELVRGVALDSSLLEYERPSGLNARVRLTDGGLVAAKSVVSSQGGVEVATFLGPKLLLSAEAISEVSFRGGKAEYLSDLAPLAVESRPFLDDKPRPWMDSNVLGLPLSIKGKTWEKGIGARGFTRIDYSAEGYSRLLAKIGVDDSAGESASVVFRVLLDEAVVFESKEMAPASDIALIDLELNGAKVISLVVDFGERGDLGDAADWCEARLIKP